MSWRSGTDGEEKGLINELIGASSRMVAVRMRLLWSAVLILHVRLLRCADVCERRELAVSGAAGGSVTLHLKVEAVDDVTWSYKHKAIASSGPHKQFNVTSPYRGKLASDQDGSLIILNLQAEDDGTYDASIKLRSGDLCLAQYRLQIYKMLSSDDIKITHVVSTHEPCRVTLTCRANQSDVIITWTSGGRNVQSNEVNVTNPEQQTMYNCTVENPVSGATKSITPWDFCEKGNKAWIGVLVFAAVFAIAVGSYLYYNHRMKTRSSSLPSAPVSNHS